MMLVFCKLKYLITVTFFLLKTVATNGEVYDLTKPISDPINLLTVKDLNDAETLSTPEINPRFRSGLAGSSGGLARKDEGSNSLVNSGWGLFSSITSTLTPQQPKQPRKHIENIPILGSLISLGGAIGLAGKRSADLIKDGSRRFGDLAVGTITQSGYKYPVPGLGADGLTNAASGIGGLSGSDLFTLASAATKSNGRADFVKHLLEDSTPEAAFRIGHAAASVAGLRSNPVLGPAANLLKQFVKRK